MFANTQDSLTDSRVNLPFHFFCFRFKGIETDELGEASDEINSEMKGIRVIARTMGRSVPMTDLDPDR
jgi:hypothetical protein